MKYPRSRITAVRPIDNLRGIRLELDLSQAELAAEAKIARKTVERAEAGRAVLPRTRRALEEALWRCHLARDGAEA